MIQSNLCYKHNMYFQLSSRFGTFVPKPCEVIRLNTLEEEDLHEVMNTPKGKKAEDSCKREYAWI